MKNVIPIFLWYYYTYNHFSQMDLTFDIGIPLLDIHILPRYWLSNTIYHENLS